MDVTHLIYGPLGWCSVVLDGLNRHRLVVGGLPTFNHVPVGAATQDRQHVIAGRLGMNSGSGWKLVVLGPGRVHSGEDRVVVRLYARLFCRGHGEPQSPRPEVQPSRSTLVAGVGRETLPLTFKCFVPSRLMLERNIFVRGTGTRWYYESGRASKSPRCQYVLPAFSRPEPACCLWRTSSVGFIQWHVVLAFGISSSNSRTTWRAMYSVCMGLVIFNKRDRLFM